MSERLSEQQRLLEASREEIEATRDAHSSQKLALERENDLLREQLKKYVSMVQAQRREVSSESSSSECSPYMVVVVFQLMLCSSQCWQCGCG